MLPRGTARGRMLGLLLAMVTWPFRLAALAARRVEATSCVLVRCRRDDHCRGATITFRIRLLRRLVWAVAAGDRGLFLIQGAQFLAVATIVVYAGAILVTFLLRVHVGPIERPSILRPCLLGAAARLGHRGCACSAG